MIVCFVDIDDHHCLNFLFIIIKGLQTTTPISAVTSTVAVQNPTTAGMVTTHAPQQNTTATATQTPSPVATTKQTTTPVVTASTVAQGMFNLAQSMFN